MYQFLSLKYLIESAQLHIIITIGQINFMTFQKTFEKIKKP